MRRGDVYWIRFDPAEGGEIRKTRPAIIISVDAFNVTSNRVQVLPLTSKRLDRIAPSHAIVQLPDGPSKALADQLTTAAVERMGRFITHLSEEDVEAVEDAIRRHLGLP